MRSQARRRASERELAAVLRSGPFEQALRLAIQVRGLTLERLHARLHERGVHVSLASLSNWQRGRSRPERSDSLRAVAELESILGLPQGALAALLGPRRPRGRWLRHVPGSLTFREICPEHSSLTELLQQIPNPADGQLTWLSHHERVTVGRERDERSVHSRAVFEARGDGVDRHVAIHRSESLPLPDIRRASYCRLGRVRTDPPAGLTAIELLFERPLATGETCLVEYEFAYAGHGPLTLEYHRGFRFPVREYLLQIQFDPAATPTRCYRTWQPNVASAASDVAELRLSSWHTVHLIESNVQPGMHGIRWEWQ